MGRVTPEHIYQPSERNPLRFGNGQWPNLHVRSDQRGGASHVSTPSRTSLPVTTTIPSHLNCDASSGEGDHHQQAYNKFRRSIGITDHDTYEAKSPVYTLALYPTDEFYEVYSTSNPKVATIGAVCAILFTSILFWLYDSLVRRELLVKKGLLDAKRKFMRFVSHEVRTPLNSVCMGISVLQQDITTALGYDSLDKLRDVVHYSSGALASESNLQHSEQIEWFKLTEDVLRHTQIAVDVLNDLLHYDKIESGNFTIEREIVPIWHLIETSIAEFKLPALQKNIAISLDFEEYILSDGSNQFCCRDSSASLSQSTLDCTVYGDASRLMQVFRNLLSNAVKFTPDGGSISIHASCSRSSCMKAPGAMDDSSLQRSGAPQESKVPVGEPVGFLSLVVQDSGAGMTKDQLAALFREGVQFNAAALQDGKGSGVGLFISKGIVDLHGGTLEATSDGLGLGTTFTVTLPLYNSPRNEETTAVEDKRGTLTLPRSGLRLLVVDDSVSNRKLLGHLLSRAGHVCDLAEDGNQALDMVIEKLKRGERYDCVLLDYEMPVMTGPEAARAIRQAGSDVHIVGVTGNVLPDDVAYFVSCGANAVLPKPVKLSDLSDLWVQHGVVGQTDGPAYLEADFP
jgi:signal transduction histidine kinase/CheY-like chemotaxis protein